jgi:hypothetical protein
LPVWAFKEEPRDAQPVPFPKAASLDGNFHG